ncbi:TIGR03089 family protein [Williamsia deligens]|uniref:TIGR03089 family protein n=1 Tax=Williamsia deligens TaxID=321325 RepID=A0ABW3G9G1_9NOCA|nr:TIGR03089 family protein [Williamsia deligens]MCP2196207.1 TIGR03089 family protein [Williamsia deligens]
MRELTITDAILQARADAAAPLITFYDDASGERTELSSTTTANWAAKVASFLRDEVGVMPGDTVAVSLPAHWQTFVVLLGSWWAGADVALGPAPAASVAFCGRDEIHHLDADEVVAVPLDPFALPVSGLPSGVVDFGSSVRVHADTFSPVVAGPSALDGRTTAEVLTAAREFAATAGITGDSRVLSSRHWDGADDVVANVLATVAVGASLVQVAHPDPSAMTSRSTTERVTLSLS